MGNAENAIKVLNHIEASDGRNRKLALLTSGKTNDILYKLFKYAYDWKVTYGMFIPEDAYTWDEHAKPGEIDKRMPQFFELMDTLKKHKLSGNAAIEAFDAFMEETKIEDGKWYVRVLDGDLRIGIADPGVIWKDLKQNFGVPLAERYEGQTLTFPIAVEPKIDGLNSTILDDKESIDGVSKSRGDREYPEKMSHFVRAIAAELHSEAVISELAADWNPKVDRQRGYNSRWGKTSSLLKTGYGKGQIFNGLSKSEMDYMRKELHLWMYDLVTQDLYDPDKSYVDVTIFKERRKKLETLYEKVHAKYPDLHIHITPLYIANNWEDVQKYYQKFLDMGYEGAMLKPLDYPAVNDRTDQMLKLKPLEEIDGIILEVIPGESGKRNADWTGSYVVALIRKKKGLDRDPKFELAKPITILDCGGAGSYSIKGITRCNARGDENREDHWRRRGSLVGMQLEMENQKEANDGGKVSVSRHPVFRRLREDLPKIPMSILQPLIDKARSEGFMEP